MTVAPQAFDPDAEIVALCGGIGGAKLALGLSRVVARGKLTVVVNTGDDFVHLGLHVSPDIDTVLYTLAGLSDPQRGWGRADETWAMMAEMERFGGETWFSLGDRDLALHLRRTQWLRDGGSLSGFVAQMATRLGITAHIIPASDDAVRTVIGTPDGELPFQRYFVERRCEPIVTSLRFDGAANAKPAPGVVDAIGRAAAIIICPSNPYLSVDPMLAVAGLRDALTMRRAPCVAVSPIIGGLAVKGPTTKIMGERGVTADNTAIAAHYAGLIDGLVIDVSDAGDATALTIPAYATHSLMRDLTDRDRLARETLAFAASLTP